MVNWVTLIELRFINYFVGMHHAGLEADDKAIVEKLFLEHKIQVLVATSTLAWGVNVIIICNDI